jgi:hypothetical protein
MIGFIDTLYTPLGTTGNYSAIADLHALQFTVTYALGFSLGLSVFTSCIPVTDLQQSHCHFKSHMKSSFHSLLPFLPLFCNCQFWRLDSIQFLCSQAHILARWCLETRLDSTQLYYAATASFGTLPYNHFARTTQKTVSLLLRRRVYSALA